jgi:hypothetical protein
VVYLATRENITLGAEETNRLNLLKKILQEKSSRRHQANRRKEEKTTDNVHIVCFVWIYIPHLFAWWPPLLFLVREFYVYIPHRTRFASLMAEII